MASSSSSSNSNSPWKYDVFLSFRGETRTKFTDHLYAALVRSGIYTFRDNNELKIGEEIRPELLKAIEESRFSIIVLSKNYASSTWCLDELEHMLACRRTRGHAVWPIFYDVDPSDVRKQKKSFDEAFAEHEARFKDDLDKVRRWRAALKEVADLKGVDIQNQADGHESKIIDNIVKEIVNRLGRKQLHVATHSVGLRYPAKNVISMLFNDFVDVCIVGIYGIGGIGKTTIAKEVYNSILHKFEASCFLANVRENSDPKGMIQLQKQLLSETLMGKHEEIYNVHRGLKVIEERLCRKRVLIVLDDVDELNQLNQILGDRRWLSSGSRVIITTRTKDLLKTSRLYKQYEVQELGHSMCLRLLSLHAFDRVDPIEDYMECAQSMVHYAGGIPLVLEVLGSSLNGEHIDVWNSTLEKLKVIPKEEIHTRLKISYDSLDHAEKSLFLDITCLFVGFDKDYVIKIVDCGFFPIAGINKLMKRCLIRIDSFNKLMMHDLLRDMGREIVRRESPVEPGNRSRLWRHEDVIDVLTNKTGTIQIEGLILDLPGQSEILSTKAFKKMNRLRLLQLNYVCLTGSFEKFPRKVRWLCWRGFPLGTIPADLHLGNLVSLDMQNSKLNQFQGDVMYLEKLKFLDLSHSHVLTKISNFEGFPNLEILSLDDCTSLVELDDSIRFLMRLHSLTLQNCTSLRSLPRSICELRSLKNLNYSFNSKPKKLPKAIRNLENLESLPLHNFPLTASPRNVPCILSILPASLEKLNFSYCNLSDDMIPHDLSGLTSLESLNLCGNNFYRLPASIGSLPKLHELYLRDCKSLQSVPQLPSSLRQLDAEYCLSLESINLLNFQECNNINLRNCSKLNVAEGYFKLEPIGVGIVEKLLRARGLFTPRSIERVRMKMFNALTDTIHLNDPLQALSQGGIYSIFLPLSDIPGWFSYQREDDKISFQVPALEHGCKIIGFIMCAVYGFGVQPATPFRFFNKIHVTIETKKFDLHYYPNVCFVNEFHRDVMWLSYWAFENMNGIINLVDVSFQDVMEEGDQVNVSIHMDSEIRVKRCGIYLLHGQNDQGSQLNDLATISCAFPRHIKATIFSTWKHFEGYDKFKTQKSLDLLSEWIRNLQPGIRENIKRIGFEPFVSSIPDYVDEQLVNVLMKRFWDTTNTIHLNFVEMTITPTDFTMITGLKFGGKPLDTKRDVYQDKEFLKYMFGMEPNMHNGVIKWEWFYHNFFRKEVDPEDEVATTQATRAFLFYLLSCTVLAGFNDIFRLEILPSLEHIDRIHEYEWGGIGWTALLFFTSQASRCIVSSLGGLGYVWQIWAYEYFGLRAPNLKKDAWPVSMRWSCKMYFENLTFLDELTKEKVNWNPWAGRAELLPKEFETCFKLSKQRVLFESPIGRMWYLGERVICQTQGAYTPVVPKPPPDSMITTYKLNKQDAQEARLGFQAMEFVKADGIYKDFCKKYLMRPHSIEVKRSPKLFSFPFTQFKQRS